MYFLITDAAYDYEDNPTHTSINLDHKGEGQIITLAGDTLFKAFSYESEFEFTTEDEISRFKHMYFEPRSENSKIYTELKPETRLHQVIVVIPIFTLSAYAESGFYDYYNGKCDSCLEAKIRFDLPPTFESSDNSIKILRLLDYPYLTDIEVDKNPSILEKYDKIILLHNEYVTKVEFDAITSHSKVIYLHPNALYAEVNVNYENNTISLKRGHGYPQSNIKNGFEWKFDNSDLEYNNCQNGWSFYEIDNGIMLNCYPENIIFNDYDLLKRIKDY